MDPCDPASKKPTNVDKTANNYQQMDATQLHRHIAPTLEDMFFEDALPAIARFFPEIAVEKHVQLLDQLFVRNGFPLRPNRTEYQRAQPVNGQKSCAETC